MEKKGKAGSKGKKSKPKVRAPFDDAAGPFEQSKFSIDPIDRPDRTIDAACSECHQCKGEADFEAKPKLKREGLDKEDPKR